MHQSPEQVRSVSSHRSLVRGLGQALVVAALIGCGGGGDGITVSNNVASLRFVAQPGNIQINQPFTVSVELLNSAGERIASATQVVTISATGATLSGGLSVAAVAGLATFTNLTVTSVGTNVQIQAAAAGRSVTSASFAATDPCAAVTITVPGNVSGSVGDASCLLGSLRASVFQFTAPASGASAFSTTATFPARTEVTTIPAGDNITFINSQGLTVNGEWLLPAGTYLFRVAARSGTGTFTVTSTNPAGNTGCVVRALVVGGTFAQNLANGDCDYGDGTFVDIFALFSSRACTVTMTSPTLDTYLEIVDVSTATVLDSDGGGPTATVQLAQCRSGGNPVAIFANTFGGTGAYTLTVELTGAEASRDIVTEVPSIPSMPAMPGLSSTAKRALRR